MKKKLLAVVLALALVLGLGASAIAATGDVDLTVYFRDIVVTRDGEKVELKDEKGNILEPFLYNESTYLPIRAIAEATGATVEWDGVTGTVSIDYPEQEPTYIYVPVEVPVEKPSKEVNLPEAVDKSSQPRIIITTDLEVDDMNGVLLSLLFSCDFDLAGIVWTAGQFHFSGDDQGTTLAEFAEEIGGYQWKCEATTAGGTVENAGQLTSFRPVDPGFLTRLIDYSYRADYEYLSQNNPNYPTPDYLLSIAKTGNIQFEGDYRYDTEGSDLIKQCILDDDMRPLHIQHWGGINTTVRALYSIYEDYYGTPEWDEVLAKVVAKVRISGNGEDNCRSFSKIDEMFPGLQASTQSGPGLGNYFQNLLVGDPSSPMPFLGTNATLNPYYQAEWFVDAVKFNHGQLMSQFHLMNDGQVIYGEPLVYQYGLINYIDWATAGVQGWGPLALAMFPRIDADTYDWMCCQWGTNSFVDMGLRQGVKNSGDALVVDIFEEWAARADWAVMAPEDCNHAPVVGADVLDFTAKAGDTVRLIGTATDPDGDQMNVTWLVPANSWTYGAATEETALTVEGAGLTGHFTVPADAVAGDRFVVTMEVQDTGVERPMTRYAQFIITVE